MSFAPSIFLPPTVPLVLAALPLSINHTTTRHVFNESTGTEPASPLSLSPGQAVIWWFCFGHGGGDLGVFETEEDSCCVAFEAVHYNQYTEIKLNSTDDF